MDTYTSQYTAKGIYSFEFLDDKGKSITEIVLILPPESVTVSESQRAELMPTLGGGYIVDYGNEFKDISISGSIHFYYVGSRKNPLATHGSFTTSDTSMLIDGFSEFIKLRYMISRYRDYTLTPNAKKIKENFSDTALSDVNALQEYVHKHGNALAPNVEVVFHDYDYDEHWKVKCDKFNISRDKSDPYTVRYDIQLKAYEKYTGTKPKKPEIKKNSTQMLLDNDTIMQQISAESMPTTIPNYGVNTLMTPPPTSGTYNPVDIDSECYVLNQRLKKYRAHYAWAINMIRSGVLDIESALSATKQQLEDIEV